MGKSKKKSQDALSSAALADRLRVGEGFDLSTVDPNGTPGFAGDKAAGEKALTAGAEALSQLQERLFAAARGGPSRRNVLLVVQGMDTSGKGGIVRHVVGAVDPQGVEHTRLADVTAVQDHPRRERADQRGGFRVRLAVSIGHHDDVQLT